MTKPNKRTGGRYDSIKIVEDVETKEIPVTLAMVCMEARKRGKLKFVLGSYVFLIECLN